MSHEHTMVKVSKETRDLLKKIAPLLEMTMQDAAALAIERLVADNAAWILRHKVNKEAK